jgi:prolactin regulatory element-binding protein
MIHAVLNATSSRKRNSPRKAFVATFGLVAPSSSTAVTKAEVEGKGKGKEGGEIGEELGRWDVLVRREVAGKPVTVFDVRSVL